MSEALPYVLRPFNYEHDSHFVYNSMQRSQRGVTPPQFSPDENFLPHITRRINLSLSRSDCGLVAGQDQTIMGYILAEKAPDSMLLHFVYVKQLFRSQKLGTELMDAAFAVCQEPKVICYTHHSQSFLQLLMAWRKKHQGTETLYYPEALK